jgi:uncharacterized membrane protein YjgN (DUF898 family)
MEPTSNAPARRELPLAFTASGSEYFRIWIVNLLLTIVTLGLYLPFAKARRLRYFYANTLVDDQPLAFHGDPWRMFRGHLLVMGFGIAYFVSGRFLPLLAAALAIAFMLVWPALWRSSLIFRLRNTSWRGLRFDFTGSLGGAYKCFLPWFGFFVGVALLGMLLALSSGAGLQPPGPLMLFVLVLGFYALAAVMGALTFVWLKRYQHGGYRFAQQQGVLKLGVGAVIKLGLKTLGLSLLALLLTGLAGYLFINAGGGQGRTLADASFLSLLPLLVMFLLFASLGPYVMARLQNLLWNGTSSRQLVFRSRLSARSLAWLSLKNWLLVVLTLGLYRPFAVVATTRLKLQAVRLGLRGDLDSWFGERVGAADNAIGEMGGDFFGFDLGL